MRRVLIAMIVALVPALAAMGEHQGDYRDDFGDGGYGGNDGNLDFGGPWVEFGDDGSSSSGMVHIGSEDCSNNDCLHFEGENLVEKPFGISRPADLSVLDGTNLTFDLRASAGLLGLLGGELRVKVFDGRGWLLVKSYGLGGGVDATKSVPLDSFDNQDFAVMFEVGALESLGDPFIGHVSVDRVVISGTPTSTTTTTKPTTTTTRAPTTTSTVPTTTTTRAPATSTSRAETTTTTVSDAASSTSSTSTTSTTISLAGGGAGPTDGNEPPPTGGLRDPGVGLMADYSRGIMGDVDMGDVEVLGVELSADFSMAVEVFETARIWLAVLALLVAAAIIAGLDRHRKIARTPHP